MGSSNDDDLPGAIAGRPRGNPVSVPGGDATIEEKRLNLRDPVTYMAPPPGAKPTAPLRTDAATRSRLLVGVLFDDRHVAIQQEMKRGLDFFRGMERDVDVFYPDFASVLARGADPGALRTLVGQICTNELLITENIPDFPLVVVIAGHRDSWDREPVVFYPSQDVAEFGKEWGRFLAVLKNAPISASPLDNADWEAITRAIWAAKFRKCKTIAKKATILLSWEALRVAVDLAFRKVSGDPA